MEVNPSMNHKEFGTLLKRIRQYNNLTQKQIAAKLNISRQAYSNYEQGRCYPPPDTLATLSVILNINLFDFFLSDELKKASKNNLSTTKEMEAIICHLNHLAKS